MSELLFKEETYQINGAIYDVFNDLGPGFLESVYQEALAMEFTSRGIPYREQWGIDVYYKNKKLKKKFFADFLCFNDIIIEIKAVEQIIGKHEAQLINYLKATKKPLGILVNFGQPKLYLKRFANTRYV